jgi:hypothetical protein
VVTNTPNSRWRSREIRRLVLDAAGEPDREATVTRGQRRALLATLIFAGLRIGEALSLRWRNVDLDRATIAVRAAKTDAGERTVNIVRVLRDELADYRAQLDPSGDAFAFGTVAGTRQDDHNLRQRALAKSIERANEKLSAAGVEVLPESLTSHSLRRTVARRATRASREPPTMSLPSHGGSANFGPGRDYPQEWAKAPASATIRRLRTPPIVGAHESKKVLVGGQMFPLSSPPAVSKTRADSDCQSRPICP